MNEILLIWLGIAVLALVLEVTTTQLIALYVGVGALIAAGVTALGAGVPVQIVVFAVVTLIALITTRTTLRRMLDRSTPLHPMNVAALVGQHAIVTKQIDNTRGEGQVLINGETWQARSAEDVIVAPDVHVVVDHIDGVSLFVKPVISG